MDPFATVKEVEDGRLEVVWNAHRLWFYGVIFGYK